MAFRRVQRAVVSILETTAYKNPKNSSSFIIVPCCVPIHFRKGACTLDFLSPALDSLVSFTLEQYHRNNLTVPAPRPLNISIHFRISDVLTDDWKIKITSELFTGKESESFFTDQSESKKFDELTIEAIKDIQEAFQASDFLKENGLIFNKTVERHQLSLFLYEDITRLNTLRGWVEGRIDLDCSSSNPISNGGDKKRIQIQ